MAAVAEHMSDIAPVTDGTPVIWEFFSPEQLQAYRECAKKSQEDASSFLSVVLGLENYRFDARDAIRLDYASYTLEFAWEQKYGPTRTMSVFRVAQHLLEVCIAGASLKDAQATFKKDLLDLCRPKVGPDGPELSPEMVSRAGQFFARTFFGHYRLYQHCFTSPQDLTEYTATLLVETPIIPGAGSFETALPEDDWIEKMDAVRREEEAAGRAREEAEAARVAAESAERVEQEKAKAEAQRQADLAKKPATLEEAIEHMVALRLEQEKVALAEEYKGKEEVLVKKIEVLEAKQQHAPPPKK